MKTICLALILSDFVTLNSEKPIFTEQRPKAYLISFNNFKTRVTASRNPRIVKGQN